MDLLHCEDKIFLNFLCTMVHPVVGNDLSEIQQLIEFFNKHLESDGYEVYESGRISGKPLYGVREIDIPIVVENLQNFDYEFVKEQLKKCDERITKKDFTGAISGARSLVEGVFTEIYLKCTGKRLENSGNLLEDYKKIKKLINLSEESMSNESLKAIINSLNGIIYGIDTISNKMGDRHRPVIEPEAYQAKFVVDCAKSLADFLFSTMEHKRSLVQNYLDKLLVEVNSNKRFWSREKLLKDKNICDILKELDTYLKEEIKTEFFRSFTVDSYRKNDIYFAFMRIFFEDLNVDDVVMIIFQSNDNDQLIGLDEFEKELGEQKPDLLRAAYEKLY
jgi:hypothetical protein